MQRKNRSAFRCRWPQMLVFVVCFCYHRYPLFTAKSSVLVRRSCRANLNEVTLAMDRRRASGIPCSVAYASTAFSSVSRRDLAQGVRYSVRRRKFPFSLLSLSELFSQNRRFCSRARGHRGRRTAHRQKSASCASRSAPRGRRHDTYLSRVPASSSRPAGSCQLQNL